MDSASFILAGSPPINGSRVTPKPSMDTFQSSMPNRRYFIYIPLKTVMLLPMERRVRH